MSHNHSLADSQKVSPLSRKVINKLHILRDLLNFHTSYILKQLPSTTEEDKKDELIKQVQDNYKEWYSNEQLLQELWNFPQDSRFIRTWTFSGCNCPSMDNEDMYPSDAYYVRGDCLVHGDTNA